MERPTNKTTNSGVTPLLLLTVTVLAGCATKPRLTFGKPRVAMADLQRDRNECVRTAFSSESGRILAPSIDRDALIRFMDVVYTVVSR